MMMRSLKFNRLPRYLGVSYCTESKMPLPNRNPELPPTKAFINNEWVANVSGETFTRINPTTGLPLVDITNSDQATLDKAVEAARKAFHPSSPWRKLSTTDKFKLFIKLAGLIERDKSYISSLETLEVGKIYSAAYNWDLNQSVRSIITAAGFQKRAIGQIIPKEKERLGYSFCEPIGVVGVISCWNFGFLLAVFKSVTALAAGCTVVLKPSSQSSLGTLHLARLFKEAGFPPGVFNVVPSTSHIGKSMSCHPGIDAISVTSSTEVGKKVYTASAKQLKKVVGNLGGKSPVIVLKDAANNLDEAVYIAQNAIFNNMGQCCVAGSRTYVHESIYDAFVEKSIELAGNRVIGDPFDFDTTHGPQVSEGNLKSILDFIDIAKKEGGKLQTGGKRLQRQGFYMEPTIFTDIHEGHTICRDEVFGPVQLIMKYKTLDEVIERANNSEFGLAAGILGRDINNINLLIEHIKSGTIWVNMYFDLALNLPFGGLKMSGLGTENGEEGIKEFMTSKTVVIKSPDRYS